MFHYQKKQLGIVKTGNVVDSIMLYWVMDCVLIAGIKKLGVGDMEQPSNKKELNQISKLTNKIAELTIENTKLMQKLVKRNNTNP